MRVCHYRSVRAGWQMHLFDHHTRQKHMHTRTVAATSLTRANPSAGPSPVILGLPAGSSINFLWGWESPSPSRRRQLGLIGGDGCWGSNPSSSSSRLGVPFQSRRDSAPPMAGRSDRRRSRGGVGSLLLFLLQVRAQSTPPPAV
jgi:hypothetical protein